MTETETTPTAGAAEDEPGLRRQLEGIVLGRIGHYSYGEPGQPSSSHSCFTAIVTHVRAEETNTWVNLACWWHGGEAFERQSVRVGPSAETATFHLTRDCPWGR